jgi:hypothetical protein
MPRCYITFSELHSITGISTEDIKDMITKEQITSYQSDDYKYLFPLTVLNQLKAMNYKNIPDIIPYGRTGYNAIDHDSLWANNGEDEIYLEPSQKLPKGYQIGRLPKKEDVSNGTMSLQEVPTTSGNEAGSEVQE